MASRARRVMAVMVMKRMTMIIEVLQSLSVLGRQGNGGLQGGRQGGVEGFK